MRINNKYVINDGVNNKKKIITNNEKIQLIINDNWVKNNDINLQKELINNENLI